MKTGIVRKIDELGRIVIPKEIRNVMQIKQGSSLEIHITENNEILLTKFNTVNNLTSISQDYCDILNNLLKTAIIITNQDNIVGCCGVSSKIIGNPISKQLKNLIDNCQDYVCKNSSDKCIGLYLKDSCNYSTQMIVNIKQDNMSMGSLILISDKDYELSTSIQNIFKVVAQLIGKSLA